MGLSLVGRLERRANVSNKHAEALDVMFLWGLALENKTNHNLLIEIYSVFRYRFLTQN